MWHHHCPAVSGDITRADTVTAQRAAEKRKVNDDEGRAPLQTFTRMAAATDLEALAKVTPLAEARDLHAGD